MNPIHKLAMAAFIAAAPSVALGQGKASHPSPPIVMGKSAPVRQDDRPAKIAAKADRAADRTADKSERAADKTADKAEKASEKTEHSELKFAHDQKLLTNGIKLTSAEKKQIKAIEKKDDAQFRSIRQKELAADKAARKNGTADSDAAFEAQLSQLDTQERADIRAVLTTQQQSVFDSNVTKLSTRK